MNDSKVFTPSTPATDAPAAPPPTVVVQYPAPNYWTFWRTRLLIGALIASILFNVSLYGTYAEYFASSEPPTEKYHSGDKAASDKIAVISVNGTIMPPMTERWIKQIDHAADDNHVKGVLLVVDSPGGLVADSQQIYHRLQKLAKKKTVYVQMKRMAASGGYYIAMGAGPGGKIFAEPTTWTGSIGVIIPRYDLSQLAQKVGVVSDPLKTGEFKDALNPFRPMTDSERKVWENILDQSFQKFIQVIDDNRDGLDRDGVKALATGQVYTADDALAAKLVDQIGYEEESLEALKTQLGLKAARAVRYETPSSLVEQLIGIEMDPTTETWKAVVESSVPRAMYLCSWWPALPESSMK